MARIFLMNACIFLLTIGSFADIEYEEHGHGHHHHHHHAHDGHDHHDHESHKSLFADPDFEGTSEEQVDRLRGIAKKIDTDQNGLISREELRSYIAERINELRKREADDFISNLDPAKTNKITLEAYIRDNYGQIDRDHLEGPDRPELNLREGRRLYALDKQKWKHLDKNSDDSLSYDEFRKFLRPEDDEGLRNIEIDSILKEYDENKDGKISKSEFFKMTEAESGQGEDLTDELDKNNDGYADYQELKNFYLPTSASATEEETDHLLKDCDINKDGYCTSDEIAQAYSSFAGSQITDYGADLETQKEEL